jgi:hypothetical protein
MIVKKSYYDMLVYLIKNTAMKARPVDGDNNDMWLCWVPEIQRMVRMDDYPICDEEIFVGMELRPEMLNRKTKYRWEISPINCNENAFIFDKVRKY